MRIAYQVEDKKRDGREHRLRWVRCEEGKGGQTNAGVKIQGIEAIFKLLQAVEFKPVVNFCSLRI